MRVVCRENSAIEGKEKDREVGSTSEENGGDGGNVLPTVWEKDR